MKKLILQKNHQMTNKKIPSKLPRMQRIKLTMTKISNLIKLSMILSTKSLSIIREKMNSLEKDFTYKIKKHQQTWLNESAHECKQKVKKIFHAIKQQAFAVFCFLFYILAKKYFDQLLDFPIWL